MSKFSTKFLGGLFQLNFVQKLAAAFIHTNSQSKILDVFEPKIFNGPFKEFWQTGLWETLLYPNKITLNFNQKIKNKNMNKHFCYTEMDMAKL